MNNTTPTPTFPASRYGARILLGNRVELADGRTGTVDEIDGTLLTVEVGVVCDEFVTVEAATVAHIFGH